jgi:dihydroflavonol-4-reductase
MRTAMISGATGFVGGALLAELLQRGWDVRALVRRGADDRNLRGHARPFDWIWGDLRDKPSLARAVEGCDVVFHVAARYSLWNPSPREIYIDNVEGTRNLLEAAQEAGVPKIVYTSTVGVLKPRTDASSVDETSIASEREISGHYKRSKWLAEKIASEMAARGLPVVIVNPSTPVGPRDVKPTPTGRLIVDFLRRRMFAYTDTGLNLVAVEDVARGHILAAERGTPGERYILGGENYSLRDLFALLAELTGLPQPRWRVPRSLLKPLAAVSTSVSRVTRQMPLVPWEAACMAQRHMYFDSSKAQKQLGFSTSDVRSALERAVAWFRDNRYSTPAKRCAVCVESIPPS